MEFRILGPLEVYDASGSRLQPPAGRERALLVALLLRRGEVVSVDALIDALWGERPPSTAAKAVQGYVSHLRRLLGPEAGEALVTQSPGYVLRVPEKQVDAARFERLASEGQHALEDGDPAGALATLDSALALWRGAALAEFAFDDFAQREIQRLTERQLEATEERIEALLQLGRHGGLVSELEAHVAAHPLRERLRGQLMLALYRSGRQADALQVYKEGGRLSRELGLEPAGELKALERAILDQDPSIAAPARAPTRADGTRELPAGTVTLLSSDIESSTELLRRVGAETWGAILSRHRELMRAAFAAHGGREVDTQGDAFFVAFARASDAVDAAVAVHRAHAAEHWPEGVHVPVRIGLHSGAPTAGPERYVGLDVHRVARVTAAAHGGEILCTASTAALVDADEADVRFVDLGVFRLKDFPRPERLLRVVSDGLPESFPPPAAEPVTVSEATRRRRRMLLVTAIPALAVVALLAGLLLERTRGAPAAVAVVPPAVAVVAADRERVVGSLDIGSRPVSLAVGFGSVWVGDGRDQTVTRIDPETRAVVARIGVGAPAVDLAVGLGSVWVATGGSGEIVRIDPGINATTDRFALSRPDDPIVPSVGSIAAGREGLWVGAFDGIVRLDPRSGRIVDRVDLGGTPGLQLAAGGGAVWATTYANRAMRVEAASGQVTADFYAGTFVFSVAVSEAAIWIGGDGGQVWKLDPATASQISSTDTHPGERADEFVDAIGIALAGADVWVTVSEQDELVRVNAESGAVEATIPLGARVEDVVVANGLVWMAAPPPAS